ncbi:hypothetical protein [Neptuniibacter sp. QD37_11]|uniref:hypothetical protein n=1 Tax=Neptuniibacter sp. QD37_11 TaxID=3398209 RepID=UPI0039F61FA0
MRTITTNYVEEGKNSLSLYENSRPLTLREVDGDLFLMVEEPSNPEGPLAEYRVAVYKTGPYGEEDIQEGFSYIDSTTSMSSSGETYLYHAYLGGQLEKESKPALALPSREVLLESERAYHDTIIDSTGAFENSLMAQPYELSAIAVYVLARAYYAHTQDLPLLVCENNSAWDVSDLQRQFLITLTAHDQGYLISLHSRQIEVAKRAFEELGGFNLSNGTQDCEIRTEILQYVPYE